jgi:cell division protein FtsL
MSDLHEVRDPEPEPQSDTEGWVILILAVGIIATAVMAAYKAHDTRIANVPVSQVVTR